jgi:UDP-N-acetylmuramoyl-L-alanyl-D-glutamate--2,6-diaminopimelate ligase
MQLTTLLEKWITLPADFAIPIHDLAINSQQVKPGDVFFAMPGSKQDGFIFVDEAIEQGAVAIIADGEIAQADYYRSIPLIRLPKLRMLCSAIAAEYFDRPSAKMTVIGITGTNGKTSCAYFLAAAFTQLGKIAGYMGTLGCGIYGQNIVETGLTTADPITIQRILAQFNVAGANVVAMEVSSHALAQSRVAGVTFTCAILTNLTQDHLDYHGTMDAYWAAKKLLFQEFHIQHAIINADDPYGRSLLTELAESSICGYTQNALDESLMPMVQASAIQFSSSGIVAQLHTPVGTGQLVSKMLGRFNLANILAVLTTLITLDVPLPEALACVCKCIALTRNQRLLWITLTHRMHLKMC